MPEIAKEFQVLAESIVIECLASSRQCRSSQITCCTASCSRLWIFEINHPAYHPHLAPDDCYLFRNLIFHLCGPGLQTMNRQKLLLKRGLKDRTFFGA